MSLPSWHSRQRAATHLIIIFGNGAQITVIDKCNKAETAPSIHQERDGGKTDLCFKALSQLNLKFKPFVLSCLEHSLDQGQTT